MINFNNPIRRAGIPRPGQRQPRPVTVAFDGVDALAGDPHRGGQLLLGPAPLAAKLLDPVCDRFSHVKFAFHFNVGHQI